MTISTILLAITGVFGGDEKTGGPASKDKGALKKCLDSLVDALKRLAGKAAEALPTIVGSVGHDTWPGSHYFWSASCLSFVIVAKLACLV